MNDRPFNAVVCRTGPCASAGKQLLERLRPATRDCPYGVLIGAGCLLGAPRCQAAPSHDSGAYLLVQPCDLDRRPKGMVIGVGPVLSDTDADAVAEWLTDGSLDADRLEDRLRLTILPAG
jgi:hypothetical protein